jgi:hypothetical protein
MVSGGTSGTPQLPMVSRSSFGLSSTVDQHEPQFTVSPGAQGG